MSRIWLPSDGVPMTPSTAHISWWSEFLPPWETRITDRKVDEVRTAELANWDDRVRTSGGQPLQFCGSQNKTVISGGKFHRMPLPNVVWVEKRTTDDNAYFIDPARGMYYEASKMGPVTLLPWLPAAWWNAYAFRAYSLKERWDAQRASITGGGLPMWPMIPKIEQLNVGAGGVQHALHFVVSGGYSNEPPIPPARKTDGTRTHPLRAGARLRLKGEAFDRLLDEGDGPHDAAIVWALRVYGCIVNDRTADVGHMLRMPLDPRLKVTVPFRLTDFEVVQ